MVLTVSDYVAIDSETRRELNRAAALRNAADQAVETAEGSAPARPTPSPTAPAPAPSAPPAAAPTPAPPLPTPAPSPQTIQDAPYEYSASTIPEPVSVPEKAPTPSTTPMPAPTWTPPAAVPEATPATPSPSPLPSPVPPAGPTTASGEQVDERREAIESSAAQYTPPPPTVTVDTPATRTVAPVVDEAKKKVPEAQSRVDQANRDIAVTETTILALREDIGTSPAMSSDRVLPQIEDLERKLAAQKQELERAQGELDYNRSVVASGNVVIYSEQAAADQKIADASSQKADDAYKAATEVLPDGMALEKGGVLSTAQVAQLTPQQRQAYDTYVNAYAVASNDRAKVNAARAAANENAALVESYGGSTVPVTVERGDTIIGLSTRTGTPRSLFYENNPQFDHRREGGGLDGSYRPGGRDPDLIHPGEQLEVSANGAGVDTINRALAPLNLGLNAPRQLPRDTANRNLEDARDASAYYNGVWSMTEASLKTTDESIPLTQAYIDVEYLKQQIRNYENEHQTILPQSSPLKVRLAAAEENVKTQEGIYNLAPDVLDFNVKLGYVEKTGANLDLDDAEQKRAEAKAGYDAWRRAHPNMLDEDNPYAAPLASAETQLRLARYRADAANANFVAAYAIWEAPTWQSDEQLSYDELSKRQYEWLGSGQPHTMSPVEQIKYGKASDEATALIILDANKRTADYRFELAQLQLSDARTAQFQARQSGDQTAIDLTTSLVTAAEDAVDRTKRTRMSVSYNLAAYDFLVHLPTELKEPQSASDNEEAQRQILAWQTEHRFDAAPLDLEIARKAVDEDLALQKDKIDNRGAFHTLVDGINEGFGGDRSELETYLEDHRKQLAELEASRSTKTDIQFQRELNAIMDDYGRDIARMRAGEEKTDGRWNMMNEGARHVAAITTAIVVTGLTGGNVAVGAMAAFGVYQAWSAADDLTVKVKGGDITADGRVSLLGLQSEVVSAAAGQQEWGAVGDAAKIAGTDVVKDGISSVTAAYSVPVGAWAATGAGKFAASRFSIKEGGRLQSMFGSAAGFTAGQVPMAAGQEVNIAIDLARQGQLFTAEGGAILLREAKNQGIYLVAAPFVGFGTGGIAAASLRGVAARETVNLGANLGTEEVRARIVDGRSATAEELAMTAGMSIPGTALGIFARPRARGTADQPGNDLPNTSYLAHTGEDGAQYLALFGPNGRSTADVDAPWRSGEPPARVVVWETSAGRDGATNGDAVHLLIRNADGTYTGRRIDADKKETTYTTGGPGTSHPLEGIRLRNTGDAIVVRGEPATSTPPQSVIQLRHPLPQQRNANGNEAADNAYVARITDASDVSELQDRLIILARQATLAAAYDTSPAPRERRTDGADTSDRGFTIRSTPGRDNLLAIARAAREKRFVRDVIDRFKQEYGALIRHDPLQTDPPVRILDAEEFREVYESYYGKDLDTPIDAFTTYLANGNPGFIYMKRAADGRLDGVGADLLWHELEHYYSSPVFRRAMDRFAPGLTQGGANALVEGAAIVGSFRNTGPAAYRDSPDGLRRYNADTRRALRPERLAAEDPMVEFYRFSGDLMETVVERLGPDGGQILKRASMGDWDAIAAVKAAVRDVIGEDALAGGVPIGAIQYGSFAPARSQSESAAIDVATEKERAPGFEIRSTASRDELVEIARIERTKELIRRGLKDVQAAFGLSSEALQNVSALDPDAFQLLLRDLGVEGEVAGVTHGFGDAEVAPRVSLQRDADVVDRIRQIDLYHELVHAFGINRAFADVARQYVAPGEADFTNLNEGVAHLEALRLVAPEPLRRDPERFAAYIRDAGTQSPAFEHATETQAALEIRTKMGEEAYLAATRHGDAAAILLFERIAADLGYVRDAGGEQPGDPMLMAKRRPRPPQVQNGVLLTQKNQAVKHLNRLPDNSLEEIRFDWTTRNSIGLRDIASAASRKLKQGGTIVFNFASNNIEGRKQVRQTLSAYSNLTVSDDGTSVVATRKWSRPQSAPIKADFSGRPAEPLPPGMLGREPPADFIDVTIEQRARKLWEQAGKQGTRGNYIRQAEIEALEAFDVDIRGAQTKYIGGTPHLVVNIANLDPTTGRATDHVLELKIETPAGTAPQPVYRAHKNQSFVTDQQGEEVRLDPGNHLAVYDPGTNTTYILDLANKRAQFFGQGVNLALNIGERPADYRAPYNEAEANVPGRWSWRRRFGALKGPARNVRIDEAGGREAKGVADLDTQVSLFGGNPAVRPPSPQVRLRIILTPYLSPLTQLMNDAGASPSGGNRVINHGGFRERLQRHSGGQDVPNLAGRAGANTELFVMGTGPGFGTGSPLSWSAWPATYAGGTRRVARRARDAGLRAANRIPGVTAKENPARSGAAADRTPFLNGGVVQQDKRYLTAMLRAEASLRKLAEAMPLVAKVYEMDGYPAHEVLQKTRELERAIFTNDAEARTSALNAFGSAHARVVTRENRQLPENKWLRRLDKRVEQLAGSQPYAAINLHLLLAGGDPARVSTAFRMLRNNIQHYRTVSGLGEFVLHDELTTPLLQKNNEHFNLGNPKHLQAAFLTLAGQHAAGKVTAVVHVFSDAKKRDEAWGASTNQRPDGRAIVTDDHRYERFYDFADLAAGLGRGMILLGSGTGAFVKPVKTLISRAEAAAHLKDASNTTRIPDVDAFLNDVFGDYGERIPVHLLKMEELAALAPELTFDVGSNIRDYNDDPHLLNGLATFVKRHENNVVVATRAHRPLTAGQYNLVGNDMHNLIAKLLQGPGDADKAKTLVHKLLNGNYGTLSARALGMETDQQGAYVAVNSGKDQKKEFSDNFDTMSRDLLSGNGFLQIRETLTRAGLLEETRSYLSVFARTVQRSKDSTFEFRAEHDALWNGVQKDGTVIVAGRRQIREATAQIFNNFDLSALRTELEKPEVQILLNSPRLALSSSAGQLGARAGTMPDRSEVAAPPFAKVPALRGEPGTPIPGEVTRAAGTALESNATGVDSLPGDLSVVVAGAVGGLTLGPGMVAFAIARLVLNQRTNRRAHLERRTFERQLSEDAQLIEKVFELFTSQRADRAREAGLPGTAIKNYLEIMHHMREELRYAHEATSRQWHASDEAQRKVLDEEAYQTYMNVIADGVARGDLALGVQASSLAAFDPRTRRGRVRNTIYTGTLTGTASFLAVNHQEALARIDAFVQLIPNPETANIVGTTLTIAYYASIAGMSINSAAKVQANRLGRRGKNTQESLLQRLEPVQLLLNALGLTGSAERYVHQSVSGDSDGDGLIDLGPLQRVLLGVASAASTSDAVMTLRDASLARRKHWTDTGQKAPPVVEQNQGQETGVRGMGTSGRTLGEGG